MENNTVNVSYEDGGSPHTMTIQQMLSRYIGQYIICELLIGLRALTVRDGVLVEVGRDYFSLRDQETGNTTSCDLYSLKFVTLPMRSDTAVNGGYTKVPAGGAGAQFGTPACMPCQQHHTQHCAPWPEAAWMRMD